MTLTEQGGWTRWRGTVRGRSAMFLVAVSCLGLLMVTGTAHAQSASGWNHRGLNAEEREDYDAAYEAYRQAHLKKPKDLRYRERYERMKFAASQMHVDRGRILRQSGDVGGAINEFARALQIDPGSQVAVQELQVTQTQTGTPPAGTTTPPQGGTTPQVPPTVSALVGEQSPYQEKVKAEIASLGSPIELQPVSNDPITLHMVEDTKNIYQAIGKAAGLNVLFDPDYKSVRIPVDLTGVSLRDALRIVGTLSKTFWKPVTANTIFVADNNQNKRHDYEDLAVQTFFLTNASQQNDANDVLVALRNVLDPSTKLYLVASQNAIVIRATAEELILAEKLINDLDRVRSEVVIDVAVLEVNRQKERDLGITLPQSVTVTAQGNSTSSSSSSSSSSSTSTSNSGLTLQNLAHLTANNFAVSIGGGTLNALLSDSDTRVLQNPRVRATDGQRATLKIGSKIPVATGSYSSGAAVTTASLGVQTQFTYLDVGVNIDITPTVHYDREITLKMKIEVSSQNGSVTISNVTEPIIAQKVAEQIIQLKDGEPSILAGLLSQQDTTSKGGTPGLGEIPLLKYFFSSTDKTVAKDEIVFLIIPHIVRESLLTGENTRAIYTGTGQSVDLIRQDPAKQVAQDNITGMSPGLTPQQPLTAANAASAAITTIGNASKPNLGPTPTAPQAAAIATQPAVATAPTGPLTLAVTPGTVSQPVGSTFQVAITANNAHDLASVPLQLQYNAAVLELVNVDQGELLSRDGQMPAMVHRVEQGGGAVSVTVDRPPNTKGIDGSGTLVTLTFRTLAAGESPISLVRMAAKDSKQQVMPVMGVPGTVKVK